MFGFNTSQKQVIRNVRGFVVVVALGVFAAGCSEVTDPNVEIPQTGGEAIEELSIVPSVDEADEAMFAVSTSVSGDTEGDSLFGQLDLTEEQRAAIRAAFADACAELTALATQLEAGEITEEEYLAAAKAVHEQLRETIWNILTEEQQAIVEENLTARLIECLNKRIDAGPEHIAKIVERMTEAFGLEEDQQAAITAVLEGALTDVTAIRDALESGETDVSQAREDLRALYQATRDAIKEVLGDVAGGEHDGTSRNRHRDRRTGRRC